MSSYRNDIQTILSKNEINRSDVGWLMICIRRLLEAANRQKTYPVLNLYCNWAAHSKLSRSKILFELLTNLSKTIGKYSTDEFNVAFGKAMTEALGVKKLREEFLIFSEEFRYPDQFWRKDMGWRAFLGLMCQVLMDVPITFPQESQMKQKVKEQWEAAKTSIAGQDGRVIDFRLITVDKKVCWKVTLEVGDPPKKITLQDSRGLLL